MSTVRYHSREQTRIARSRLVVAILHLAALAGLLHIGPTFAAAPATSDGSMADGADLVRFWQAGFALLALTCSVAAAVLSPARGGRKLRGVLLPCLSLPPWDDDKSHAWIPGLGWRVVDAQLREDVEKRFTVPMVGIALLVLPLFAVEHYCREQIDNSVLLTSLLTAASAAVWAAFTFEFVVRCSIAEKKFAYAKKHWLDLAIILLPLVAFLRAARLARLTSVHQTARVFRLRGVAMRLWKAVILFDLLERILFRTPEKRLAHLERKRAALSNDLRALDAKIAVIAEQRRAA